MLDVQCLEYVGKEVWAVPRYGWGWTLGSRGSMPFGDYGTIEAAGPFAIRVASFFDFQNELRGILGVVTSRQHPFHALHVVSAQMLGPEMTDLTGRICSRWDIALGTHGPVGSGWATFDAASLAYEGSATIGASVELIEAAWAAL